MFAYCLNNPVKHIDLSGNMAKENCGSLTHNRSFLAEMGGAIGMAVAGAIIIGNTIDQTSIARLIDEIKEIFDFAKSAPSIEDHLTNVAGKYEIGKCDEAAKAMERHLKRKGEDYQLWEITFIGGSGYVFSKKYPGEPIGDNLFHIGVEYKGIIYCNIHPYGLPSEVWKNDFYGLGIKDVRPVLFV